ncbi:MAG: SRPBCC family protein [Acidimicrobiales bacterium]
MTGDPRDGGIAGDGDQQGVTDRDRGADEAREQPDGGGCAEVTRSVDLDAARDEVWAAVADPERRHGWLDDEEAADRELRIDEVDAGHSLAWTWWSPDDPASASRVEVVLTELDSGGTRVAVTERLVGPAHIVARAAASASVAAGAEAGSLWDRRLLGLELLFLAAGVCVG